MLTFSADHTDHGNYAQERREAEQVLEAIMDRYTWDGLIDMLTGICHEKANHVAERTL
jgi:hypothetical protein